MTARRGFARRTVALAVTASVAALTLAACGDNSDSKGSGGTKAGGHNAADVSFSKEMIQHHRQAVEMAGLAADRASSAQVKSLATKIKGAQDPEIKTMSGWLTSWGEKVPQDMTGMGHDMSSSAFGMMTEADMGKLEKASGTMFDSMFLNMMVEHHEGAVAMAKTEKADGSYRPATELAADVITAQSAEITQMNKMLGKG
ncbi:Uncharacterized conserved protein, DUF305 family [Streptomyces sp. 3213]|uniref:DUF305 domain-containing protein n=1 Tax=Streptomyces sp. 3213.3 TaxID=1855348 RepID=UPI00089646C7|nr:DUF305 domain-containing protein [Streptomyces sp. 3213.3]SEC80426.1 Uncharacterized conserved protein, DUF305 family [Streptomyces sp. 3213] [Streptomyces sp. 3213.3]